MRIPRFAKVLVVFLAGVMLVQLLHAALDNRGMNTAYVLCNVYTVIILV